MERGSAVVLTTAKPLQGYHASKNPWKARRRLHDAFRRVWTQEAVFAWCAALLEQGCYTRPWANPGKLIVYKQFIE